MGKIFFTADCHFHHPNIIKYCNRPFNNIEHMHTTIISRWNRAISPQDTVYHIGDFSFGKPQDAYEMQKQLNGTIVHIRGNHDKNIPTYIVSCLMEFGGCIFYVTHKPPEEYQSGTLEEKIIDSCDVILCGHVHDLWRWKINWANKICINVGQDVWGFEPIRIHSILRLVAKVNKGFYGKEIQGM